MHRDNLHVNAELHRGRYAGTFYQKRQDGPGMESGILHVSAKDLIHLGDNLRMFVFVESMEFGKDAGGCRYHITFHPSTKDELLKFLKTRLDNRFSYTMTSTPIRTPSQHERKQTLRSLRVTDATEASERKKKLDTLQAGVLCHAILRGDTNCIQDKMKELGSAILDMPLDACGITMLHYTAQRQLYDVMFFLLSRGARKKTKLADGRSAMDLLMRTKRTDGFFICYHLLLGSELLDAAKEHCEPFVRFAVTVMKKDVNERNSFGMTCLHYCFKGSTKLDDLAVFLVENGAEIHAENTMGVSGLESCKNRELRDKLQSIYKLRKEETLVHCPDSRVVGMKRVERVKKKPVGEFWGSKNAPIPSIASQEFGNWYSKGFRQWANHVSIASKK